MWATFCCVAVSLSCLAFAFITVSFGVAVGSLKFVNKRARLMS